MFGIITRIRYRNESKLIEKLGCEEFVGGKYDEIGVFQFNALKKYFNLSRNMKFLDVGAGSLRLGRYLIEYLSEGGYYALEQHKALITSGIEANNIQRKFHIHLSNNFIVPEENLYDIAWANSIFSHLTLSEIEKAIKNILNSVKPGGVFIFTFFEGRRNIVNEMLGSHSHVDFYYRYSDILETCLECNVDIELCTAIKHPRGQKIVKLTKHLDGERKVGAK
jgi:SAM-dependent methyltransferase